MLPDWYLRLSAASGAAYAGPWSNADVAIVALAVFAACFALAAFLAIDWLLDVAVAALVTGGLVLKWPGMVALTMAAVVVAIVLSYLHQWLAPRRAAEVSAEADRLAAAAVADFKRDMGSHWEQR